MANLSIVEKFEQIVVNCSSEKHIHACFSDQSLAWGTFHNESWAGVRACLQVNQIIWNEKKCWSSSAIQSPIALRNCVQKQIEPNDKNLIRTHDRL